MIIIITLRCAADYKLGIKVKDFVHRNLNLLDNKHFERGLKIYRSLTPGSDISSVEPRPTVSNSPRPNNIVTDFFFAAADIQIQFLDSKNPFWGLSKVYRKFIKKEAKEEKKYYRFIDWSLLLKLLSP